MNCMSEELIQKYIDGETSMNEMIYIEKHVAHCSSCADRIEEQRKMADHLKESIRQMEVEVNFIPPIRVPDGKRQKHRMSFYKRYVYSLSAACILALVFIVPYYCNRSTGDETILVSGFGNNFDSNLPISDNELIIEVIDPDGNITEYFPQ